MGYTYFEIFTNFNKRLFYWFLDLFDHKIVPNVPTDPKNPKSILSKLTKTNWSSTDTTPIDKSVFNPFTNQPLSEFSLRELYKNPVNININTTPWYRDLSTWMWLGTTLSVIGIGYLGYIYLGETISNFFGYGNHVDPAVIASTDGSLTPTVENITKNSLGFKSVISNTVKKLNPFNWFLVSSEADVQFKRFMEKQSELVTQDNRFYPFTQINPNASWLDRMRIHYFDETLSELTQRLEHRALASRELLRLGVRNIPSTPVTPQIAMVGLGLDIPSGVIDYASASKTATSVWNKLDSLPSTPKNIPLSPILPDFDGSNWQNNTKDLATDIDNYLRNKHSSIFPSKKPFILKTENQFSLLNEETI